MIRTCTAVALVMFVAVLPSTVDAQKVKPETIVQGHIERTLGPVDRGASGGEVRGACRMTTATLGAGSLEGPFTMTGTPDASAFDLKFENENYEGESFRFDGKKVDIAFAQPRTSMRSAMGLFLSLNPVIVREGLLGGVLSARWPLFHAAIRDAKLSYDGLRKLDGQELHRLRYRASRDQGDLSIHLYFTLETFRHVATTYEASRAQGIGGTIESSSRESDQRFRLQESFFDFDTPSAPLPARWVLRYTRTGNTTAEWKYECQVRQVRSLVSVK